jgi:hypothetical protein
LELAFASFDNQSDLVPHNEECTIRRLSWPTPLAVPLFAHDRET